MCNIDLCVYKIISKLSCVCEMQVVMTVVLGQRCFDSLSKHKHMWTKEYGWNGFVFVGQL